MTSPTEEKSVPQSQNEAQTRTDPCEPKPRAPWSIFRNMGENAPESRPFGASALDSY